MVKVYLFDWGDTLMVDFPDRSGKMCDWTKVQAVEGAEETLKKLSGDHLVYIATNAADSSVHDIKSAFERVGLNQYIRGYFCKANLGTGKGTPEFFRRIISQVDQEANTIVMVGDSLEKDIEPAVAAGIQAIWFNPSGDSHQLPLGVKQIRHLAELCV